MVAERGYGCYNCCTDGVEEKINQKQDKKLSRTVRSIFRSHKHVHAVADQLEKQREFLIYIPFNKTIEFGITSSLYFNCMFTSD